MREKTQSGKKHCVQEQEKGYSMCATKHTKHRLVMVQQQQQCECSGEKRGRPERPKETETKDAKWERDMHNMNAGTGEEEGRE